MCTVMVKTRRKQSWRSQEDDIKIPLALTRINKSRNDSISWTAHVRCFGIKDRGQTERLGMCEGGTVNVSISAVLNDS